MSDFDLPLHVVVDDAALAVGVHLYGPFPGSDIESLTTWLDLSDVTGGGDLSVAILGADRATQPTSRLASIGSSGPHGTTGLRVLKVAEVDVPPHLWVQVTVGTAAVGARVALQRRA